MHRIALLCLLLAPASLSAQARQFPQPRTIAGPLARNTPNTLFRESIARLELGRSVKSQRRTGAIIGVVVGGVATYAVLHSGGSTAPCNRSENQDAMSSGECIGLTAAGAAVGAGLGALIGGLFHSSGSANLRTFAVRLHY
jgi:hypothetical protein